MKRSVGIVATILLSILGFFQVRPVSGQYNVFLTSSADVDTWSGKYEIIRYNEQLNILTVRGTLSPFFTSTQDNVTKVVTDIEMTIQDAPNDTYWNQLWGMRKITEGGASYDITTGSSRVVVAVVDTGVSTTHPDLRAVCKRSTVGGTCEDGHGHGTHVSGTIAAIINNRLGVAGVVSSNLVNVWGYKVLSDEGYGTSSSVAQGITLATNDIVAAGYRGVINMSLGADTFGFPEPTINAAINYAVSRGVVVVSSAGNSGKPYCMAPAISANSMCVGAITQAGDKANFSDYGKGLDIVAPGVGIRSTIPGGRYATWNGTSMATPHVTGAVAALLSAHPDWNVSTVKKVLLDNADRHRGSDPNNFYGAGAVNVARSLTTPTPWPTATIVRPTATTVMSTPIPKPTITLRPRPEQFWIHCIKKGTNWDCQVEGR